MSYDLRLSARAGRSHETPARTRPQLSFTVRVMLTVTGSDWPDRLEPRNLGLNDGIPFRSVNGGRVP